MIIGKVGSGKSTLLLGLLDEIYNNKVNKCVDGSFAYVEQDPVILNGTI
jgi:ABC-type lipoprotein export system ATPase subunit